MGSRIRPVPALLSALAVLLSAGEAKAGGPPPLVDLNASQASNVFNTFASDFVFRPLEPPHTYGKYFGFSFGVVAGATSTDHIDKIAPGADLLPYIPTAYAYFGVQLPLGLAVELGVFPKRSLDGFTFDFFGGDVKWTLTPPESRLGVAVRAMASRASLSYSETIDGIGDTTRLSTTNYGANVSFGINGHLFGSASRPYGGVGILGNTSTLSSSGAIQLFDSSATSGTSYTAQNVGFWGYVGWQLRFVVLTVTAEIDETFGILSGTAKVGFRF